MQRNDYRYKRITYFQELCTAVPLRLALSSSTVWLPYLSSNTCCNTHCVSSYHHHSLKQLQDQLYPTSIHCRVGCCEQTLVGILVSPTAFAVVDATSLQDKLKSIIIYYLKKKQKNKQGFFKNLPRWATDTGRLFSILSSLLALLPPLNWISVRGGLLGDSDRVLEDAASCSSGHITKKYRLRGVIQACCILNYILRYSTVLLVLQLFFKFHNS